MGKLTAEETKELEALCMTVGETADRARAVIAGGYIERDILYRSA